ncbi:conserved Plasmodium protein, unknown function [Plasmodium malariae]|uniref:Exportin-2 C-terminal domain-containing protein n=1 Tax=Plasmodium malariae TaxID=5858 RepID=A0A1D3JN60_PLAMA|nr:conserved Plasmodium protein, unknown function [Plasmodium malariae]SBT87983.1 conserved Plasmodium protein, unknown function [Plasmodium malariae]
MEEKIEKDLLTIFTQSVSNNFEEIKCSEGKIAALYNDSNKENYIKILLKFIVYPYNEKNEKKNYYDNYLNKNVKTSILISIKNYIKKSVHSSLDNVELSSDICIFIKHICMHMLLDITNEDITTLQKYLFEILTHLFKYNICDDYDYLLFYIILLYINDYNYVHLINIFDSDEKKNNADAIKIVECVMLYIRNKDILKNINQDNFFLEYNKFISNIDSIKMIINNRNNSLNDDILNYINNTKKIYKSNDVYNVFLLNDFHLYNMDEANGVGNSGIGGNTMIGGNAMMSGSNVIGGSMMGGSMMGGSMMGGSIMGGSIMGGSIMGGSMMNNNLMSSNLMGNNLTGGSLIDSTGYSSPGRVNEKGTLHGNMNNSESLGGFNFIGKGSIIKDYNNNVKLIPVSKCSSIFKNLNVIHFEKKYTALKIVRKILKKYKDNDYISKYDLKIILTHIEYPLTLYFIYLYNKFMEYTNFINYKLNTTNNSFSSNSSDEKQVNEEINMCFHTMNQVVLNIYVLLKIFYNINIIDLPEYYEDNFDIFFTIFYHFLLYDNNDILKNYFNHINLLTSMKTTSNVVMASTSTSNYITNKPNFFLTNDDKKNGFTHLSHENLNKLKINFEQNILKCKIKIIDIIKVVSENYQDESKTYIVKLIYSLLQILYKESEKNLLCHNYNCLSSTIKLIHHMNLEKNDLNPYKDKQFLEKIIERVLHHIRLKRIDIDEIIEADLDYFRNDLNNVNAFSIRSTATHFLKTLCMNYFDICFPILEFRILSKDSLITLTSPCAVTTSGVNNITSSGVNSTSGVSSSTVIGKEDPYYEACNMEYKTQLITCLNQTNLAKNFYEHNIRNVLKEFIVSFQMKFRNLNTLCYNINDYNFVNPHMNTLSNKCVWVVNEQLFNTKNTIYLLSMLKFLLNNRSIICTAHDDALSIFPFLHFLLYNEKAMIYNYACLCINRMLNQQLNPELMNVIYSSSIPDILNRLLFLLKLHVHNKLLNEYVLITIMRIFLIYSERLTNVYVTVLLIIDNIIKLIINDSHNPLFNHYLFELLTIIISLIYKSQIVSSINQVEEIIITTFSQILQIYIHDFIPYIFQILSIIIDNTNTIQKVHIKILNNLYETDLWRSTIGNANGIICVLKSYFKKYNVFQDIIKNNMQQLFNIYHYCLSNKRLSTDSFQIILIIFTYLPVETYQSFLKPLFVLLFTFLQQYKNDIIKIKVIHSISVLILKTDVSLIFNVLKSLYMPILDKLINVNEKIIIFIALTKLISNEKIRNESFVVDILNLLNKNITNNELVLKKAKTHHLDVEKDEMDKNFEVTYVKLQMINNDNINDTVLRDININMELKQNLYNPIFMQICHNNSFNSILQLFNS